VLTESNIPGVTAFASAGIPSEMANLKSWQFAFNRAERSAGDPGPRTRASLPRLDLRDEELSILRYRSAALEEYTRQYSRRSHARCFAWSGHNFDAGGSSAGEGARAQAMTMRIGARRIRRVGDALRATVATIGDRVQGARSPEAGLPADGCGHFSRRKPDADRGCPQVLAVDAAMR